MSSAQERAVEVIRSAWRKGWSGATPERDFAAALAAAGLLVDDDTASERSTAKKCWRCGGRGTWYPPDEWWHECYCDICEKGAAMTAAAYGESASHRPPDSPTPPETPSEGTPVPPEASGGDTGAVSGTVPDLVVALVRKSGYLPNINPVGDGDEVLWSVSLIFAGELVETEAPTLLAALEAAVRAVAGEDE